MVTTTTRKIQTWTSISSKNDDDDHDVDCHGGVLLVIFYRLHHCCVIDYAIERSWMSMIEK